MYFKFRMSRGMSHVLIHLIDRVTNTVRRTTIIASEAPIMVEICGLTITPDDIGLTMYLCFDGNS